MRVPSWLRMCSTRYPDLILPSTAIVYAASYAPSVTRTRRNVACGSAAAQKIFSPNSALSPFSFTVIVTLSVSTTAGRGSVLLTAQKPASGFGTVTDEICVGSRW